MSIPAPLTSGKLNLQIDPTFTGVLDKRCYGSMNARPSTYAAPGLIRFEPDNNGGSLVYYDGSSWIEVSTGGSSFPNLGYLYENDVMTLWDSSKYTASTMLTPLPKWFLRFSSESVDGNVLELNSDLLQVMNTYEESPDVNKTRLMIEVNQHSVSLTAPVEIQTTNSTFPPLSVTNNAVNIAANKDFAIGNRLNVYSTDIEVLTGKLTIKNENSLLKAEGDLDVAGTLRVWDTTLQQYINVTTTAITPALLGTLDDGTTDITAGMVVHNAIGDVREGTTVQELMDDPRFNTVQKLLASMLKIGPEFLISLAPRGLAVTVSYSGTGVGSGSTSKDIRVGTLIQSIQFTVTVNRGYWSPTQTSGPSYAYGRVTNVNLVEPFTNSSPNFTIPGDTTQDTNSSGIIMLGTTVVNTAYQVLTNAVTTHQIACTVTLATGPDAYNKTLGPFNVPGAVHSMTNSITFRTYAEVLRVIAGTAYLNDMTGAPDTDGYSGNASTTKIFVTTNEIIAANMSASDVLSIPFTNTFQLYQFSQFLGNKYNLQDADSYTVTSNIRSFSNGTNSFSVQYYDIAFTNTGREPADIKITFT